MSKLKWILLIALVGFAAWFFLNPDNDVSHVVSQYVSNGEILTLEARYTADQIMSQNGKKLLVDDKHSFQDPTLKFYPYLLMDVKYTSNDKKTREGVLLWGMEDGEIVINTENWETTHGYTDCIDASANRNDYKLIQTLEANNGTMSRDDLIEKLHVESDTLDSWINSAMGKHLIAQQGNNYYLHFQNPKICVSPSTKISQPLVSKPYNHAMKVAKRYSKSDIEKNAKAVFGADFTIRNSKEVFLPVYSIEVLNPDGSVLTTYWNALSGQRMYPRL
jgi:hypothetical protein